MHRGFISRTPRLPGHIGRTQLLFFEPEGGANPPGGQGGQGGQGDTDRQNLQGLLARHNNDAMAVVATLLSENHSLRDERRQLRGQLPGQGAVVLTPEQATQWQAYVQLGAPDALTSQLKERETFQGQLQGFQREKLLGEVASVAGYKASVLGKLPGADKLGFEIRESTVDGKPVKSVVVKDGDKETPLADYAKSTWADFLPALQAGQAQQPAGTTFVHQSPGGAPPASSLDTYAKRFQEQRD
ncbi:MAG TPA: hypothetical protein VFU22_09340, partial [Roseiflexaceae bacterium]|nr:hypothetical protein [Roseiflexaceae bacterium]